MNHHSRHHHHHHPPHGTAEPPPPLAPTDGGDPFVLEMGASVAVNDDMRRTIAKETGDIEAAMAATHQEATHEQAASQEIAQRRERGCWEVMGMRAESAEFLDQIRMNQQIFGGLQQTLESQIHVVVPLDDDDDEEIQPENGAPAALLLEQDENTPPPQQHSPVSVVEKFQLHVHKIADESGWLDEQAAHVADVVQEWMHRKDATAHAMQAVLDGITANQLKVAKANARHHTEQAQTQCREEADRQQAAQAKLDQINKSNATLEQRVQEKTAAAEAQTKADEAKEAELEKLLAALEEEEIRLAEEEAAALEKENTLLDQQLEQVQSQVDVATQLLDQRQEETAKLDQARTDRNALYTEKVELEPQVATIKETIEENQRAVLKPQAIADNIAVLKTENDAIDADHLRAELAEAKVVLEQRAAVLENNGVEDGDDAAAKPEAERALLEAATTALAQIDAELAQATAQLQDKNTVAVPQSEGVLTGHREEHDRVWQAVMAELEATSSQCQAAQDRHQFVDCKEEATALGRQYKIWRHACKVHRAERKKSDKTE